MWHFWRNMMRKVMLVFLIILTVSGLIFIGCSTPATSTTPPVQSSAPPASPAGPPQILIGSVLPLTGDLAGFGQGGAFGLQAAVDDINQQGGILVKQYNRKLPVKLVQVDDQSNSLNSGTLAESLVLHDNVNFLTGSPQSPPAFAAIANVSQKYKIPYVDDSGPFEPYNAQRSQASPVWTYAWATGFHIGAPYAQGDYRYNLPGYTIVDVASGLIKQFADQTNKKTAIFASDEPDGRGWYTSFPAGLTQMGLIVDGADKELGLAPPGTTDFSSVIKQWINNDDQIMFGNALAPWFGTLWKQCKELGFKPKLVYAGRAAIYYTDVNSWGGDLANGIGCEQIWSPAFDPKVCPGIGNTTPQSFYQRWVNAKNQPTNPAIGRGYGNAQVLFDAIQRAGTLDKDAVNAALAKTDLPTICGRVVYDQSQFNGYALSFGQWFKTDKSYKWEWQTVVSSISWIPTTAKPLFPIP
jgi:branched-chain amino acid transport system substrate-binding protein